MYWRMSSKENSVNESFVNIVWTSVSKDVFVDSYTLKLSIYDVVIIFTADNDGRLEEVGVKWTYWKNWTRSELIMQNYKPKYCLKR